MMFKFGSSYTKVEHNELIEFIAETVFFLVWRIGKDIIILYTI